MVTYIFSGNPLAHPKIAIFIPLGNHYQLFITTADTRVLCGVFGELSNKLAVGSYKPNTYPFCRRAKSPNKFFPFLKSYMSGTSHFWESPSRPCCYPFPSSMIIQCSKSYQVERCLSWRFQVAGLSLATISGFRYGGTTCFHGPVEVWRMNFVACSFVGDQGTIYRTGTFGLLVKDGESKKDGL